MTKRWWRTFQHIPHGLLVGALAILNSPLMWAFLVGFLVYEVIEDWRIADHSYIDIQGFLIGLAVAAIFYIGYRIWRWWRRDDDSIR